MQGWIEVALRSFVGFILLIAIGRIFVRKPIGETSQLEFGLIAAVSIILAIGSIQLAIPISYLLVALLIWAGGRLELHFSVLKMPLSVQPFLGKVFLL
ncbi:hypothetical protein [Halalkalibacter krulwichiae]|uniref:DUF421 domain-containing protein n=1 Tax=Halalkalibacter krulwichiae TaxID=199441 RepID=A0A1X9MBY3_9BACI|nr:hypothetical protein [Halalkalibacter krulwichiae]ARK29663.1 hypothetical protein BkAM31D_07210 [Halalkalibacter krulwichiae]